MCNLVDPFFGSGAVLLGRPQPFSGPETVNDKDAFICNFFRAVAADPEAVAHWADKPVNESDQHAVHAWLVGQRDTFVPRLEGDPDFYDARVAGWWCWGICCWIGGGWCSGDGPWHVIDGQLVRDSSNGQGVNRQLVHLGDQGQGVNRQRVHLGNAGQGVNRQRVHLGGHSAVGQGINNATEAGLLAWMAALSDRLRRVRVCCGDWTRVLGPSVTEKHGLTGIFLDPPYTAKAGRDGNLYREEDPDIGHAVAAWAIEHGDNPLLRIALCGYEGEYEIPDSWDNYEWSAGDSYGSSASGNRHKERVWFSPACLKPAVTLSLFSNITSNQRTLSP
uniref:Putative methyltransferase n=1 Tax=viral metagenome TaxID=1070528 RepID=A0A6M3XKK2_9ZZZZ